MQQQHQMSTALYQITINLLKEVLLRVKTVEITDTATMVPVSEVEIVNNEYKNLPWELIRWTCHPFKLCRLP